jgi:hypothetical protein
MSALLRPFSKAFTFLFGRRLGMFTESVSGRCFCPQVSAVLFRRVGPLSSARMRFQVSRLSRQGWRSVLAWELKSRSVCGRPHDSFKHRHVY